RNRFSAAAVLMAVRPIQCSNTERERLNQQLIGSLDAAAAGEPAKNIAPGSRRIAIGIQPARHAIQTIGTAIIPLESGKQQRAALLSLPRQMILNLQPKRGNSALQADMKRNLDILSFKR